MWTKYQPIEGTLIDAERYGMELQQALDKVNGHLTGQELPLACIGPTQLAGPGIFIQYDTVDFECPDLTDSAITANGGFKYSQVFGGWQSPTVGVSFNCADGNIQINSDVLYWLEKAPETVSKISSIATRVLLDGVVVAQSTGVYKPAGNILLQTSAPIGAGAHRIGIQCLVKPVTVPNMAATCPMTASDVAGYWRGNLTYLLRQR